MNETISNLMFLFFIIVIANIPYKLTIAKTTNWTWATLLSIWFIICCAVLLNDNLSKIHINYNFLPIAIFALTSCIWFIFPKFIRKFGKFPTYYFRDKKNESRFVARLEHPTLTVKYFEIIFQQVSFSYLVFIILSDYSDFNRILMFTLIVAIIHLGNLLFMHYWWTLFYTLLSVPMAILFGYLMLNGLVFLTATIHLTYYLVANGKLWLNKKT